MARHILIRGPRAEAARLLPFAKHKMDLLVRWLRKSDKHYFTKTIQGDDGSRIRLEVAGQNEWITIEPEGGGIYSAGGLGDRSVQRVAGANRPQAAFRLAGIIRNQSALNGVLFHAVRGRGFTMSFEEETTNTFEFFVYLTRRIADQRQVASFFSSESFYRRATTLDWPKGAVSVVDDETTDITFGFSTWSPGQNEYRQGAPLYFYTLDLGENWSFTNLISGQDFPHSIGLPARLGPSLLFFFIPVFHPDDLNISGYSKEANYVAVSRDNGRTVDERTVPLALTNELRDPPETAAGQSLEGYNIDLSSTRYMAITLSTGDHIHVFKSDAFKTDDREKAHFFRSSNGQVDFNLVTKVRRPDADNVFGARLQAPRSVALTNGLPVVQLLWLGNDSEGATVGLEDIYVGTEDGSSWERRSLPHPYPFSGFVEAYSRTQLVVTGYDESTERRNEADEKIGDFKIYTSNDSGQTWNETGVVWSGAPRPEDSTDRFGVLAILRRNGQPANTFPGQPWIGDSRVTPPWESE